MAEPTKKRLLTTADETSTSANTKKKKQIRRLEEGKRITRRKTHHNVWMQLLFAIGVAKEHKMEIFEITTLNALNIMLNIYEINLFTCPMHQHGTLHSNVLF